MMIADETKLRKIFDTKWLFTWIMIPMMVYFKLVYMTCRYICKTIFELYIDTQNGNTNSLDDAGNDGALPIDAVDNITHDDSVNVADG